MSINKLRWGIMGTANIARKNWQAIHLSGNGTVTAVASRDVQKSRRYIEENQRQVPQDAPPEALGSYEALLQSKNVDAVYIPLPTGSRKEWVLKAAAAGKHIVCEKPCAISLSELQEMVAACAQHRVQFMDGVMFMHSRRLNLIREVLDAGQHVGTLRRIATSFSFCAPEEFFTGNIRGDSRLEPHGCLGDLGWYNIRFALWALKWQLPRQVIGRILSQTNRADGAGSVPTEFSAELFFQNGPSMTFYCSFITENQQWVHLSGTKGSLLVSDFVLPVFGSTAGFTTHNPHFEVNGCDFNMEARVRQHEVQEYSNSHSTSQETMLFKNFSAQVLSGKLNEEWPTIAVKTQQVMEACLESARSGSKPVNL
jgi:predicted dehydrogenase